MQGFACMPSCDHVTISQNSSKVPKPGQRDEGVGALGHEPLSLVHRVDHDELGQFPEAHLTPVEGFRNDAGDASARGQGGLRHGAHQADASAAVHEFEPGLGQRAPDVPRHLAEARVVAGTGPAEDADPLQH